MALTGASPAVAPRAGVRRVTILGSTGSVGCNTVDLIERHRERFAVEAITANSNVELLADQARRLRARLAVIADPARYLALKEALAGTSVEIAAGPQALVEAAIRPADWVMAAIVGAAGLEPTLAAVRRGAVVGLANKESLVCAGTLMMQTLRDSGATLIPVDSEHSAIFQVFDFARPEQVQRIVLTASGGPFRNWSLADMAAATPEQAVAHPNWDMGAKISVDSATLMNKGLELIEAACLFPVPPQRIEIVVHPQSVIHSMVGYVDGSILAQLGSPDMRTPIAYALAWPQRMNAPSEQLDFARLGALTFEAPDAVRFPALRLARDALVAGGGVPTVLNAANEVAVAAFLERRVGFLDIARVVEDTLARIDAEPRIGGQLRTLADVFAVDDLARRRASEIVARLNPNRPAGG
ncbi:MAG TPA: 1-deoxy-D-xylulose-5-phosphate reductoisomerase [Lacipirellulaceae bacterium]|nr:1-deoxy-D-xylulose-5-phosphate reductoisomerase [Lacipirellulaceae bacterium]